MRNDETNMQEPAEPESEMVAEHHFTCSACPGCGNPHYIDGCPDCGYGIDDCFPTREEEA